MVIRQKLLEKALNDACTYIHDDGYNGCPGNYDNKTVTNGKNERMLWMLLLL